VGPGDYGTTTDAGRPVERCRSSVREQRTAKAVVVFAYSSRARLIKGADKGKLKLLRTGSVGLVMGSSTRSATRARST